MKKKKNTSFGIIAKIALLLLLIYLVFSFINDFYQAYHLKQEIKILREELEDLQEMNQELQGEVDYLRSEEAIEELARERLGLIKPGEVLVKPAKDKD